MNGASFDVDQCTPVQPVEVSICHWGIFDKHAEGPKASAVLTSQEDVMPHGDSKDFWAFVVSRLAMCWTGLAASSAAIVRSGAGGIGAAIPRRPVAKIALALRTAVGCRRPHWVFIEGAPGKARCV